jgi:hypothetical protein
LTESFGAAEAEADLIRLKSDNEILLVDCFPQYPVDIEFNYTLNYLLAYIVHNLSNQPIASARFHDRRRVRDTLPSLSSSYRENCTRPRKEQSLQRLRPSLPRTSGDIMSYNNSQDGQQGKPQVQACRYKTGKTLGAGSYSVVKECVHIDTGRYYAAKVINKRLMAGREHMVCAY